LQALNLLNDPAFLEAAQAFSARLLVEARGDFEPRLNFAYREALGRAPSAAEVSRLRLYYDRQRKLLADDAQSIAQLAPHQPDGSTPLEMAVWTTLASVLMNLDEFITRE
jgi:hypothetical protein